MNINFIFSFMFIIISNTEAIKKAKENGGKPIYEFASNKAVAYKMENGKILIFPNEGDSSLLFENESEFNTFLKSPQFPSSNNDLFYRYKSLFKNLNKNRNTFYALLSEHLGEKIHPIRDESELKELLEKINLQKKINNETFVPLGIVIGEYLRVEYKFKWVKTVAYTFDPYYIPILENKYGIKFGLWKILNEFNDKHKINVDIFLEKIHSFNELTRINFE